jgi:PHD/YefM family antitoxin component YafN of YafNO toxin-antitoxin module
MSISFPLSKIVPFSKARDTFSTLYDQVEKERVIVISKQNKSRVALIDLEYLSSLLREVEIQKAKQLEETIRRKFDTYLKERYPGQDITEELAYEAITGEKLTW